MAPPSPTYAEDDAGPIMSRVFPGDGELARASRARDWSATPLGPVEGWPESLRTAVSAVVAAPFPMMLAWGPELIQLYNDGYRGMIGNKHPDALGQPVSECWAEIWSDIRPLFERVMAGEPLERENLALTINRAGAPEQAYFTFAYSPVRDESGEVAGVLDVAFETTEQVEGRRLQEEREQIRRALDVERSRLAYVFQRAPTFLAVLRAPDWTFELANDAYHRLVGRSGLEGRRLLDAVPEVRDQGFVDLLERVLETGEPYLGQAASVVLDRTPGKPMEERFVDFVYLPFIDPDGSRTGVIAHGSDVTDHVRAKREVERLLKASEEARDEAEAARREAGEANRSKTRFLSAMSHELRTPLNAIGGYTQLVQMGIHGPVTETQHEALDRVTASQRHLLILINDILSHARLEAGRLEFDVVPVGVAELLEGVEPLILPQARAKDIHLSVRPCEPGARLVGDEERVRQILLNLAGNAVKFTGERGMIELSCALEPEWVSIRVRDDGPGISPDDQDAIFDAFRQAGRIRDDPHAGVGLGLAISRDLASAMGGDLQVESALGSGSTFTLRMPRHREGAASGP